MRPCFLCRKNFSRLARHIKKKHKDDHRVVRAMEKPLKERNKIFQSFKKEGMRLENIKRLADNSPNFLRERKIRKCETLIMCSSCHGFFAKSYFSRHMRKCGSDSCDARISIPVEDILKEPLKGLKEEFKKIVLSVMRDQF